MLPGEVEKYYRDNEPQYTTAEQVRASHILLKTEGKDEAAVKAKAEALLKQVKGGADFAALAKKESEDDQSKAQGGDLDYFGRGRMVKEFEDVAFSLPVGQVSEVVKSSFGFHIIKVTDKKPEARRSLDEVRQQITDQLAFERAQTQASGAGRPDGQGRQDAGRSRARRQVARTHGRPSRACSPATSRLRRWAPPRKSPPGLRAERRARWPVRCASRAGC